MPHASQYTSEAAFSLWVRWIDDVRRGRGNGKVKNSTLNARY